MVSQIGASKGHYPLPQPLPSLSSSSPFIPLLFSSSFPSHLLPSTSLSTYFTPYQVRTETRWMTSGMGGKIGSRESWPVPNIITGCLGGKPWGPGTMDSPPPS